MLIEREASVLLLVDVQQRLLSRVHEWQRLLYNTIWLTRIAQRLGVPVAATEQYPAGLGHIEHDLRALLPDEACAGKLAFSCVAADCLSALPGNGRQQVVICGIEAHVCVLQTALDLWAQDRDVFVVADAVSSRHPADKELALARMRTYGIDVVSREMVVFEWLRRAGNAEFREISKEFLR